ncbi:hypothetical protein CesoFtcFv8_021248 [Champsocephalus esox]|uniref:Uncharacterized protein n=2 Tax=Champsocephalus TaxID=52236 RepID=A0AAN8HB75_CHAGU|nr:hypothetical protein CesoFtcFv8_021248 [Champsocephalus esox]KAK5908737.1 hypothetical protein CgunFtcFv8_016770 [Champsocephalus gunnari]
MQLPVVPTSLPASTSAGEEDREEAGNGRVNGRKEMERRWTGWYYLHILWLKPKTFEFVQLKKEETRLTDMQPIV